MGEDEPDGQALDALAGAFFCRSVFLDLLGSGWLRRDVAVAVAVRLAEQSRGRGAIFAANRRGVVKAMRALRVTQEEIAIALCGMARPPSLNLLAWIARMVRA